MNTKPRKTLIHKASKPVYDHQGSKDECKISTTVNSEKIALV